MSDIKLEYGKSVIIVSQKREDFTDQRKRSRFRN